jgi:uncharacterized membrane protein YagU involved in acid resistance
MNKIYLVPSFYAHIINGILLLIAIILLCKNYSNIKNIDSYKIIILILLFSISIGIHGLSHSLLEKNYNYNKIVNNI